MNKFSMGNAFNEAKAFILQNPLLYFGLMILVQIIAALIIFLPMGGAAGFSALAASSSNPLAMQQMMGGFGLLFFVSLIVGIAVTLSGNYAVWRHGLANGTVSVGEALAYGFKACLPALLFVVVGYILLAIGSFIIMFIFGGIGAVTGSTGVAGLFTGIGGIIIIAGMVYLLARLSIMGPEMADNQDINPFAAAGRSWRATEGNGWMIGLFFVLCYIVWFVIYFVAALIAGAIGGASGSGVVMFLAFLIFMLPVAIVGILLGVGLPAGVYRDLVGSANKTEIFN